MNSQQEYDVFVAKLAKAVMDLEKDFYHLSPENQQRFLSTTNTVLRGYGCAVTIEELIRRGIW